MDAYCFTCGQRFYSRQESSDRFRFFCCDRCYVDGHAKQSMNRSLATIATMLEKVNNALVRIEQHMEGKGKTDGRND